MAHIFSSSKTKDLNSNSLNLDGNKSAVFVISIIQCRASISHIRSKLFFGVFFCYCFPLANRLYIYFYSCWQYHGGRYRNREDKQLSQGDETKHVCVNSRFHLRMDDRPLENSTLCNMLVKFFFLPFCTLSLHDSSYRAVPQRKCKKWHHLSF